LNEIEERVAAATGTNAAHRTERIQSVWSGYGELARYSLQGVRPSTVVVKHVQPPDDSGLSHARKLRSYEVEAEWYRTRASQLPPTCRVARAYLVDELPDGWLFVLEDLDAAGFDQRTRSPDPSRRTACLEWLATFHAHHLGRSPAGLWPTGTYWHLATRPDELQAMRPGPLREAAQAIDARLEAATFKTVVHGDAKPANFCFTSDSSAVAAVDFQYSGGGCGVRDVAYFLQGTSAHERGLDIYFRALRAALSDDVDADAVETEWRSLYPWAVADFQRFLAGWSPSWRSASAIEEKWTEEVIQEALA
jgi:hypothetical protein